ncbi:hypothetical protein [Lactobacillus sp.]|uniref:hypothetical protein n=1 Tax=Lactobacillus sp. TaxID=1591 RepID=UPI0019AC4A2E|nr:hypothetical protein [Lactobacillus sp.]MBD5429519.1 hypothetical protein [Lactobacillus sp.]
MAEKRYPELVELFYQFNQASKINLDKEMIFESLKKKGFLDEKGNPILNEGTISLMKTMKKYQDQEKEYK